MEKYLKKQKIEPKNGSDDVEIDVSTLPRDPGLRAPIMSYNPDIRDRIRTHYLRQGPCQPRTLTFPFTMFGKVSRRFSPTWFDHCPDWLEYSVHKDAVFCLPCYVFSPNKNSQQGGRDCFVAQGFSNWKKKDRLRTHVGGPNSAHNDAVRKCQDLMKQDRQIVPVTRAPGVLFNSLVDCVRYLIRQGIAFPLEGETRESEDRGIYHALLQFVADHNGDIKSLMVEMGEENQKDIVRVASAETVSAIIKDIGDSFYCILVAESHDVEHVMIVLRYVDSDGRVVERFVGIERVSVSEPLSLKTAVDKFVSRHGLNISKLRGQGYEASNIQDKFKSLKTLILNENPCAFHVHCFSHQLQNALVAIAKRHIQIASFFCWVTRLVNFVSAPSINIDDLAVAPTNGETSNGQGLDQRFALNRPGDTHYDMLSSLIAMFVSVVDDLDTIVEDDVSKVDRRCEAISLLKVMDSFDFVLSLHLMMAILEITNELSKTLEKRDEDVVNAMSLVGASKQQLQTMRDSGWDSFFDQVSSFCSQNKIKIPDMDALHLTRKRQTQQITNLHHFRVDLFNFVIDTQLEELNDRFTEANMELLLCMACLSPRNSFGGFDKNKLIHLAKLYPQDFSETDLVALDDQLEAYIVDVATGKEFTELKGIGDVAKIMVVTEKDKVYPLVHRLVTLALVLPVATATIERAFSVTNVAKTKLGDQIGDEWMNDSLVLYIERDVFDSIENEAIMHRYQDLKENTVET